MIPALLTCVYVIYLYRTLNPSVRATSPESADREPLTAAALQSRLSSLEARIRGLAARKEGTP